MKTKYALAAIILCLPLMLQAAEKTTTRTVQQAKARLLEVRPGLRVTELKKAEVDGFFEVTVQGGMTLYMSDTADFLFSGDLFLLQTGGMVNATERARTAHRKELLEGLNEEETLNYSPAPEFVQKTITVFTDIDCGYCRKLHQEVPELNELGIAVRYLAYPRAGVGSKSYDKIVSAWCAENPEVALTRAKAGEIIEARTCDNPVASHYALGSEFGVTGTPAIVYENGTLQAGYLPAAEMARRLGVN